MKPTRTVIVCSAICVALRTSPAEELRHVQQRSANGILEGVVSADGKVRTFKGVPYAAPPVGPLRWKPPQPVPPCAGVRQAIDFGPRPMQWRVFDDMVFRDAGPSEDCLCLNVWIPDELPRKNLPVMVWIYGWFSGRRHFRTARTAAISARKASSSSA